MYLIIILCKQLEIQVSILYTNKLQLYMKYFHQIQIIYTPLILRIPIKYL